MPPSCYQGESMTLIGQIVNSFIITNFIFALIIDWKKIRKKWR